MRKKSKFPLPLIVTLCLTLCLSSLGVTYATWNEHLQISTKFTTGNLNVLFNSDQKQFYRLGLYDASKQTIELIADQELITVELEEKNQRVKISIKDSLLNDTLKKLTSTDYMLVLQYPLDLGTDSTVNKVEVIKADFNTPCQEEDKVEFKASRFSLVVDGSEDCLPGLIMDEYSMSLKFDVYRQVEVKDNQLLATIYLRLTNGDDLKGLTKDFTLDQTDLGVAQLARYVTDQETGTFKAEVKVVYEAVVPVLVEQGHEKSMNIKKDNINLGFPESWLIGEDTIKLEAYEKSLYEQEITDNLSLFKDKTVEQELIKPVAVEEELLEESFIQEEVIQEETAQEQILELESPASNREE